MKNRKESKVELEDTDTTLQAIENRLHKIGWKFAIKPYKINNNYNRFQLEITQNQAQNSDDKESVIITRSSHDLSITFPEEDRSNYSHKKFRNLEELLDFIEDHLTKRKN